MVDASSQWTDSGAYAWYALQALGTPNTFDFGGDFGDTATAWAPETEYGTNEWLTLGFANPVQANGVLIRETWGNGFVTQVDLIDTSNASHTVWTGTDTSATGNPVDFVIAFTQTTYDVQAVKIFVTEPSQDAWPEIDAVRLLSATAPTPPSGVPTASAGSATVAEDTSTTDVDQSVNIPVSSLVSGPSNDPLMVSITGDGPANGTAAVNDNGTPNDPIDDFITYSPNPLFNGSDSFTIQVTDIYGATATSTMTITVTPVNHTPDAEDTNAVTDKNNAVVVDVLSNDSDPDGDTLTVSSVTNGANGTVAITGSDVTYTPASGYVGLDQFTYTISDGNGGTATATVYVNVYESGEWASSVVNVSSQYDPGDGSTDYAATQALGAPDTFAYGDSPTAWAPAALDTSSESLTVGFTTPAPATGVIVRENNGNGFVSMIEVQDTSNAWYTIWTGTDTSTQAAVTDFVVSFPATSYDVQAVRITVDPTIDPNDYAEIDAVRLVTGGSPTGTSTGTSAFYQAPVSTDVWASTNVTTATTIAVLASASDPGGLTLTVSAVGSAADGTVSIATGGSAVIYTPNTGYSGPDSFTYTITDGQNTVTSTAYVNVANGQWASSVVGSSSQADDGTYGTSIWAMGPGDTSAYGDTSTSWSPELQQHSDFGISHARHRQPRLCQRRPRARIVRQRLHHRDRPAGHDRRLAHRLDRDRHHAGRQCAELRRYLHDDLL